MIGGVPKDISRLQEALIGVAARESQSAYSLVTTLSYGFASFYSSQDLGTRQSRFCHRQDSVIREPLCGRVIHERFKCIMRKEQLPIGNLLKDEVMNLFP